MFREFIVSKMSEIAIVSGILLLFGMIFFVFGLPVSAFLLGLAIVIFIYVIYLIVGLFNFSKARDTLLELEEAKNYIKELKQKNAGYKNDVESYFIVWIHQMKTPITASKMLLAQEEVNTIQLKEEMLQIDNYTNLTLSYLKLMNHDKEMNFARTSLHDIIQPILRRYSILFINDKTRLHYSRIDDEVLTDIQWMRIMIEQLLNNALKYSKGKDIWIEYDVQEQVLIIKDNGVGISEEDLPKIFDRGYSGFNGRINDKASGLGLFIVKQIAERLSQPVTVTSKVGEGSLFKVKFRSTDD
jgi:two-component system sensor histidine kinase BraS/BceS